MKLHHVVNEHPAWFSVERLPYRPSFLKKFCADVQSWALEETEKDSWKEIEALQLKRLRRLLNLAYYKVPFWHVVMREVGVRPQDIKNMKDLQRIPIITKEKLKKIPLHQRTVLSTQRPHFYQKVTSGSTGVPTTIVLDKYLSERYSAMRERGVRWIVGPANKSDLTIRINKREEFFPGYRSFINVQDFDHIEVVRELLCKICKNESCIISANPSIMVRLASLAQLSADELSFKAVFLGGELVQRSAMQFISEVFQCPVAGRYTTSESNTIANMCKYGHYHTSPDQHYIEIIGGDTSKSNKNKVGKILLTDFNSHAMPLIRYEIGDLGVLITDHQCKCGSMFPIIKFIGRDIGTITLPNGHTRFVTRILAPLATLEKRPWILQFQMIRKNLTDFEILLVTTHQETQTDIDALMQALQKRLGRGTHITIKCVPEIRAQDGRKLLSYISLV